MCEGIEESRILLVLGPGSNGLGILQMLSQEGCTCLSVAQSGSDALAQAGVQDGIQPENTVSRFDVVITQMDLPDMTGMDLCGMLKSNRGYVSIPVMVVLESGMDFPIESALRVKIFDFFIQPLDWKSFLYKVKIALRVSRDVGALIQQEALLSELNRKIVKDLNIATQLQKQLLPLPLKMEELNISGLYRPIEYLGGDLYYWEKIDDHRISVVLLDVMGHGTATAMICMYIRSFFKELVRTCPDVESFMRRLNEIVLEFNSQIIGDDYFCTGFYMIIDTQDKQISYVNAGHPPVAFIQNRQSVKWLEIGCPPVGMFPGITVSSEVFGYSEEARILLYSDGIYDLFGALGIDIEYFLHFSKFYSGMGREGTTMIEKIASFIDQVPHNDDISLVYVELRP